MDLLLLVSRLQFAFTPIFHIIFPTFTIGLSACILRPFELTRAMQTGILRRVKSHWH
jgi:cytochrome bd-type quinol oxidase subunit 1